MGFFADVFFGKGWEDRDDHARTLYDMSVGRVPNHTPRLASHEMRMCIREMRADQRFREKRARNGY